MTATNLGFPYIGSSRELKKHLEAYWAKPTSLTQSSLLEEAKKLRKLHWQVQKDQGVQILPVGDFTLYDRVLDTAYDFGVIPERYASLQPGLEQYFAMARGLQREASDSSPKIDVNASEMKKWFDTNYHFIVPEFDPSQKFALHRTRLVDEFTEASAAFDGGAKHLRPVLLGPLSFLALGKPVSSHPEFEPITLLHSLLPVYADLLASLASAGAEWVQIDEPVLLYDQLSPKMKQDLATAYEYFNTARLSKHLPKILVATYFGSIEEEYLKILKDLVDGIHLDLVRAPEQLDFALALLKPFKIDVSLGLVDGRNIWINDLNKSLQLATKAVQELGIDRVLIAPSCSLLHSPYSITHEKKIMQETQVPLSEWLAFAVEKCKEVSLLASALRNPEAAKSSLEQNARVLEARKNSKLTFDRDVRGRVRAIPDSFWQRASPYTLRSKAQKQKLKLPLFPTTTIGSFPQTNAIRIARQKYHNGELDEEAYQAFIRKEIEKAVRFQEEIGLDVLVHGESERNDMVEHFGHLLFGFEFTENGWVVSYGSRCVKPPIVYGDIKRKHPMTIEIIKYAQSLTKKPMKGMLTGPITMLKWSFVRDDIELSELCKQIALALRDEVIDLEAAGIPCIQVDEPAIREALPLKRRDWQKYLEWSVPCFRLCTSGVRDQTQIHTHMCYSDFNEIFDAIKELDADVIAIENSKSDMKLLRIFQTKQYTNEIGPGIYDVHSPRVPSVEEMTARCENILKYIPKELLWINPDCGLKSRGWKEVEQSLRNLVAVAQVLRGKSTGDTEGR